MQKLELQQNQLLQQKLSPQQIQIVKMLELPTLELEERINQELIENPALEEGHDFDNDSINSVISLIGIANPIPSILAELLLPLEEYLAELIPTTSPLLLRRAPPLLPPLIAASNWIILFE